MPFPSTMLELITAGYRSLRVDACPECGAEVGIFSTPGSRDLPDDRKRTIAINLMSVPDSPAVRHILTCGQTTAPITQPAPPPISMYGVTDKNMVACGWRDGTLEIAFRYGRYSYANVPENIFVTLRKVPYPNNYFTKTVKNHPELYPFTKLS